MLRCVFSALLAISFLCAQGERGGFNGTVMDASGAAVPGATVEAVETQTGVVTRAVTTDAGIYRIPYLPPGQYKITVTKPGFRSVANDNVTLRVAQTLTVDFKMEVGQVSESVQVTSDPPLIETGTGGALPVAPAAQPARR